MAAAAASGSGKTKKSQKNATSRATPPIESVRNAVVRANAMNASFLPPVCRIGDVYYQEDFGHSVSYLRRRREYRRLGIRRVDRRRDFEYYWGEHIHLGWYEDEDLANGAGTLLGNDVTDFKEAKFAFVDKMCDWSIQDLFGKQPANILDVGCGIGGASRHLAKRYGNGTEVTGITLSPNQRDRATELAKEQMFQTWTSKS